MFTISITLLLVHQNGDRIDLQSDTCACKICEYVNFFSQYRCTSMLFAHFTSIVFKSTFSQTADAASRSLASYKFFVSCCATLKRSHARIRVRALHATRRTEYAVANRNHVLQRTERKHDGTRKESKFDQHGNFEKAHGRTRKMQLIFGRLCRAQRSSRQLNVSSRK